MTGPNIFITGAGGYLGTQLVRALTDARVPVGRVVASDIRDIPAGKRLDGITYEVADVRSKDLAGLLQKHAIDVVVHLASIVTPDKHATREFLYSVDVEGTRNVLEAATAAGVGKLVVSSSGAAYGYHADNPAWITEDCPLRGNKAFAYAWHKRLVEEMLADWRSSHPQLKQVILRISTILGETVDNQITAMFKRPRVLAIRGATSPFVFIHDQDVVGALLRAIESDAGGAWNLAGDGALTIDEIATRLGKPCIHLPAWLVKAGLALLKPFGLTRYGPEQVAFLRYRPVLDNNRLKSEFGYTPRYSTTEAFDAWCRAQGYSGP